MYRAFAISALAAVLAVGASAAAIGWYAVKLLKAATATVETINRPCMKGKPCGTLADVNQTLATVRGTFGQVEVAARHENRQLDTLDGQERDLFTNLQGAITDARGTIRQATTLEAAATDAANSAAVTITAAQPVLTKAGNATDALTGTAKALTATANATTDRISDKHVDALMAHLDGTATNLDGATGDVKDAFDEVRNPPKCKGHFCWAITTVKAISAAHNVPEFGYWAEQFFSALH